MPFPTSPAPPGERRGGATGERLLATGPGRGRTRAPERQEPSRGTERVTGAPRGRGWRTVVPPPGTGTQRRRRRRTGGGGGQEAGGRGGPPPWERTREGARERAGQGQERPGGGGPAARGGGGRSRREERRARRAAGDGRGHPPTRGGAPPGESWPSPRGRTGRTNPGRHTVYHRRRTHTRRTGGPAWPRTSRRPGSLHQPTSREGPRGGQGPTAPTAVARGGEPPNPQPAHRDEHPPTATARPACPPPHPVRAREGAAARPRPVNQGEARRRRGGGHHPAGTEGAPEAARGRAARRGNRGEDLGHGVGPPGKQAGSHRHTRGRSRTACDANPASGPSPGASHETRRPATTGWPSARRDAPGLRTPACNATPRAGRVPRPGPLQLRGLLAHHPARGTLRGGAAAAAPRASAHARRPPAGPGPGAGRGPLAAGEGERGTGPLNPRPRGQGPTRRHRAHTHTRRASGPHGGPTRAPGGPARPSGNPPPTRRGEARAAIGTESRRSAPTRGGPADPCPPRRRGGGDSRLHTPPTAA